MRALLLLVSLFSVGQAQAPLLAPPLSALQGQVRAWEHGGRAVGVLADFGPDDDRQVLLARGTVDAGGQLHLPLTVTEALSQRLVGLDTLLQDPTDNCAQRSGELVIRPAGTPAYAVTEMQVAVEGRTFPSLGSILADDLWEGDLRLSSHTDALEGQPGMESQMLERRLVYVSQAVQVGGQIRCVSAYNGIVKVTQYRLDLPAGWSLIQTHQDFGTPELRRTVTLAPPDTVQLWTTD